MSKNHLKSLGFWFISKFPKHKWFSIRSKLYDLKQKRYAQRPPSYIGGRHAGVTPHLFFSSRTRPNDLDSTFLEVSWPTRLLRQTRCYIKNTLVSWLPRAVRLGKSQLNSEKKIERTNFSGSKWINTIQTYRFWIREFKTHKPTKYEITSHCTV